MGVATKSSTQKGAHAVCTFEGTGVALDGLYHPSGGKADIFLDGEQVTSIAIDTWVPEGTSDIDLWHRFELAPGKHELKVVVTGEQNAQSRGSQVVLRAIITYQKGS